MEFETNGRTDGHTRQRRPPRSPPSRRVDVAATRDKPTDGQTPRIIFTASDRPSVSYMEFDTNFAHVHRTAYGSGTVLVLILVIGCR